MVDFHDDFKFRIFSWIDLSLNQSGKRLNVKKGKLTWKQCSLSLNWWMWATDSLKQCYIERRVPSSLNTKIQKREKNPILVKKKELIPKLDFCPIFSPFFARAADIQMSIKSESARIRESVSTFWNKERKIYNICKNGRKRRDKILPPARLERMYKMSRSERSGNDLSFILYLLMKFSNLTLSSRR